MYNRWVSLNGELDTMEILNAAWDPTEQRWSYLNVCMNVCLNVCMYVCMYACLYECIYVSLLVWNP